MGKFDDLLNEFFGKNEENNNGNNDRNDELNDKAKKIIDMIDSFKNINSNGIYTGKELENLDHELDDKLGEPDKIIHSKQGDMYIEKRMWRKEHGVIIKTILSDVPFENQEVEPEPTLEDKLAEAVKSEQYELAASIRDQIKKAVAKAKRLEKKRLKEEQENGK